MVEQQNDGTLVFKLFRPGAQCVGLAGDFNGWQADAMPMVHADGDWWACRLRLPPGVYQFKYVIDGAWMPDYAAFGLELGAFGWNSVLFVQDSVPNEIRPARLVDRLSSRNGSRDSMRSPSRRRDDRVAVEPLVEEQLSGRMMVSFPAAGTVHDGKSETQADPDPCLVHSAADGAALWH